jgi:hypothetical protein
MNDITADRIRSAATFLSTPVAQRCREHLADPLQASLNLIDCLNESSERITSAELAVKIKSRFKQNLDRETITQILRALKEGGMPIESSSKGWKTKKGVASRYRIS